MKKITSLMLILMLTACVFVGCGGSAASTDSSASETAVDSQETATATDSEDATVMDELVEVYNEVAALAVENGWDADELTVKELGAADELITELDTNIRQRVSEPFA